MPCQRSDAVRVGGYVELLGIRKFALIPIAAPTRHRRALPAGTFVPWNSVSRATYPVLRPRHGRPSARWSGDRQHLVSSTIQAGAAIGFVDRQSWRVC